MPATMRLRLDDVRDPALAKVYCRNLGTDDETWSAEITIGRGDAVWGISTPDFNCDTMLRQWIMQRAAQNNLNVDMVYPASVAAEKVQLSHHSMRDHDTMSGGRAR